MWVPKVGEMVRVRPREELEKRNHSPTLNGYMMRDAGETFTVKKIENVPFPGDYIIKLEGDGGWSWTVDWLEPISYPHGTSNLEKLGGV